jgi:hypothetical protein
MCIQHHIDALQVEMFHVGSMLTWHVSTAAMLPLGRQPCCLWALES